MTTGRVIPAHEPIGQPRAANIIFGLGNGALMMALFGFGWLGWAFNVGNMFTPTLMVLFYAAFLILVAASIFAIRRGKVLRKIYFEALGPAGAKIATQFRLVVILEFVGIALAFSLLEFVLHRPDLLAIWIGLVVGIHFLLLARLFHFRAYYWTGIAICVWDALCWSTFRPPATTVWAALGNGTALWLTVIYALLHCRQLAQDLPAS
ncbi:MAG: hypothetical protein ACYC92_05910 [Candidatus Acidiferrales bacterium]